MKMTTAALALSGLAFQALASASDTPPRAYPTLDKEATTLALVVANASKATMLPLSEECRTGSRAAPDGKVSIVWCLHSPLYFKADVLMPVYGKLPASSLYISTSSHWGTSRVDNARSPVLMVLHTDGKHTVMPAYAMQSLVPDSSGELYLVMRSHNRSMACASRAIRQPIDTLDLPVQDLIAEDQVPVYEKTNLDEYLVKVDGGYRPKYAISMTRLRDHLEHMKLGPNTPCPK